MTNADIDDILDAYRTVGDAGYLPALVAEVRRLRAEVESKVQNSTRLSAAVAASLERDAELRALDGFPQVVPFPLRGTPESMRALAAALWRAADESEGGR